jgi:hypothetical protein
MLNTPGPSARRIALRSVRTLAVYLVRLGLSHLQPFSLLRHEHSLAVPGRGVPALGRGCVEIVEDDNAQRRSERTVRRFAFGRVAANVVQRAELPAANLGQGIPDLRLQPDAGPVSVDVHIANHKRAVSLRIFIRSRETVGKCGTRESHGRSVSYDQAANLSSRRRWE